MTDPGWIKREWEVVSGAPFSVGALVVAGIIGTFAVTGYFASQRIQTRDEKIVDYERKLGIVSPNQTVYSVLNNRELKQRALNAVRGIQAFVRNAEGQARTEFRDHVASTMRRPPTEVELEAAWNAYQPAATLTRANTRDGFSVYKAEAIGLRTELQKRLNEPLLETTRRLYESASDRREMAAIADDLNRLLMSLPD